MTSDQLSIQIETYSNAIVGFIAIQALAFSFSFGTNEYFNCLVKNASHLAAGLTAHFGVVAILSCWAMIFFSRAMQRLSPNFGPILRKVYLGRIVIILLLTSLPITLTVVYGFVDHPNAVVCEHSSK